MKKLAILKTAGQKAIKEEVDMNAIIRSDLLRISKKYVSTFGDPEQAGSWSNLLATNSMDQSASTVKLKLKDSAKMTLNINLPWNQAENEFAKITGIPEIEIYLAGIVGV